MAEDHPFGPGSHAQRPRAGEGARQPGNPICGKMAGVFYRACLTQCSGIEQLLEVNADEYPRAFQDEYENYMDNQRDEASALEFDRYAALSGL